MAVRRWRSVSSAIARSAISGTDCGAQTNPVVPSSMISGRPPTRRRPPAPRTPSLRARPGRSSPAPTAAGTDRRPTATAPGPAARRGTRRAPPGRRRPPAARCRRAPVRRRSARAARGRGRRIRRNTSMASVHPLDRPEVRDMDQRAPRYPAGASRARSAGIEPAAILAAVEKVRDHGDRVTHAERGDRVGAQALGHRGHGVRPLDREGHHPRHTTDRCRPA